MAHDEVIEMALLVNGDEKARQGMAERIYASEDGLLRREILSAILAMQGGKEDILQQVLGVGVISRDFADMAKNLRLDVEDVARGFIDYELQDMCRTRWIVWAGDRYLPSCSFPYGLVPAQRQAS